MSCLPKCFRLAVVFLVACVIAVAGSPAVTHAQTSPAVTFEKVLELLELEVKEAKLLSLIEQSPTTFVLGEEQVRILEQAGATDAVIAAMQKKGSTITPGSDISEFVVILDCFGSMKDQIAGGSTKWQALAKVIARSDYDLFEAANDHEFALVAILKLAPAKAGDALGVAFKATRRRSPGPRRRSASSASDRVSPA